MKEVGRGRMMGAEGEGAGEVVMGTWEVAATEVTTSEMMRVAASSAAWASVNAVAAAAFIYQVATLCKALYSNPSRDLTSTWSLLSATSYS